MPEIKNTFLQGKMNKDLDDRLLPNGEYRDAFNIKISKSDASDVGTAQNIKGNTEKYTTISTVTGQDDLQTIGYYVDKLTGDLFWFTTNFTGIEDDDPTKLENGDRFATSSNNTCRIYYKSALGSSGGATVLIDSYRLNFSLKHPILHVNKVGNLLFWTDNYNQPRRINIDIAVANATSSDNNYYSNDAALEDKISVAQYAPASAPKITMSKQTSSTVGSLHIKDRFVKFAYRFQYKNKEYSLISPFTQTCFHPGIGKNFNIGEMAAGDAGLLTSAEETSAVQETTVASFQNLANRVELFIDLPSQNSPDNVAACEINSASGASGSSPYNIGTGALISNLTTSNDGDLIVTERGDNYIAALGSDPGDGNATSTIGTTVDIDATTPLINEQRLYIFEEPAEYENDLDIEKIQILYTESDSLALKVVDTINFAEEVFDGTPTSNSSLVNNITYRAEPLSGNSAKLIYGYKFTYDSTKPIQTLPESELIRVSDIIPVKAKTQEVSGNRVIYGNFYQNRNIDNLTLKKDTFSASSGDQEKFNASYLLSSVKSNREYSLGLVLSDRYGRQSTVYLPTDSTEFVQPKTGDVSSWTHYSLKLDFIRKIGDVYSADTNPLGWYSYRVVVKQSEQEYYNVYAPTIVDNIPSGNTRSWLTLHGDNINKVPRDVTDQNQDTGVQGSQTKLLPKILDVGAGQTQQSGNDYIDVTSIGTVDEQGTGHTEFYLNEKDSLQAELPDGYGKNHQSSSVFSDLIVLETKPFSSALDIYYETSTAGLISHLNEAIEISLGATPNSITLSASSINEDQASGTKVADLTTLDTTGTAVTTPTYTIVSITDGNGVNRAGAFVIDGEDIDTGETFEFKNTSSDSYTIRLNSSDGSNSITQDKTITIGNVSPTITVGAALSIAASTTVGTAVRTVTAVNGSAKTSANTNSLTFAITSGNTDTDFAIDSATGVITTLNTLTSGDTYSLTIEVTDVGGLTDSATLSITVTATTYTEFWRSTGDTSESAACNQAVGTAAYFIATASETTPDNGTTIYSNQSGTVFNGNGNYYSFWPNPHDGVPGSSGTNSSYVGIINSSGVLSGKTLCT